MSQFSQFPASQKLQLLAANPIDLTKQLLADRIHQYTARACGLTLLYGAERVDEAVLESLFNLARQANASDKMLAMQAGQTINQISGFDSEQRAVLHTAMRDVFTERRQELLASQASAAAEKELQKLEKFLSQIEGKFTDLIQIGIGGSDLGPRALCLALEAFQEAGKKIHFISNVDPDDAARVINQVDLKKALVVVVSKSGTTLETLTNEAFVREQMVRQGISNPKDHFVAVTGEKGPMDDPQRYLESFYIWDFVGGRYSATSMVGGVALGFAFGFDQFKQLLRGAHEMDRHTLQAPLEHNLPLLSALLGIWNRNFLHLPTVAIIPYSQALSRFPAHLQQLDMESNGKHIDKQGNKVDSPTGPVIWGEPGTNGQHSFYQLIHQGSDVIPVEFIGFLRSQYNNDLEIEQTTSQQKLLANLFAQSIALSVGQLSENPNKQFEGNRPNRLVMADRLDPYTMGALLSFYEHKVAFQGFIWNINSFDQEGVQLGKKLANQILGLMKGKEAEQTGAAVPLATAYLAEVGL